MRAAEGREQLPRVGVADVRPESFLICKSYNRANYQVNMAILYGSAERRASSAGQTLALRAKERARCREVH